MSVAPDGGLRLGWTRRARGAWLWLDGVDAPLAEQAETYVVTLGDTGAPLTMWETQVPELVLDAGTVAALRGSATGQLFAVRQRGSRALSPPLTLGALT
jgi:hypothetical protein